MRINSKWLINTYTFKTALEVGGREEFKLENVVGYWEQNNVFEFRLNRIQKNLLLTFPTSVLSSGSWA